MPSLQIVNLKCHGCANTITTALHKKGYKDIRVDHEQSKVAFQGNPAEARSILLRLGYPEKGSEQAKSLLKKATSFASCARGRLHS